MTSHIWKVYHLKLQIFLLLFKGFGKEKAVKKYVILLIWNNWSAIDDVILYLLKSQKATSNPLGNPFLYPSIHHSFLLTLRFRPDTFASTSVCPALPDVPPSSPSIQTSYSFPSLPFTSRSSSFFPRVSKLTQSLHAWLLDSLLNICPIYLQPRHSRMVSLVGLVLVRRIALHLRFHRPSNSHDFL